MASVTIEKERCKGCGLCVKFCPKGLLGIASESNESGYFPAEVLKEGCVGCLSCALMCPDTAIRVKQ